MMSDSNLLPVTDAEPSPQKGTWRRAVLDFFGAQPRWVNWSISLTSVVLIGWIDEETGWEVSLFILYALPIMQAVWFVGLRAGVVCGLLSALAWWLANYDDSPYETQLGYALAMVNRLIYFLFVAVGISAIRKKQEADATQIRMLREVRQLEKEIVLVSEHEQQRIGQDLHDGLCQQLAAIGCAIRVLAEDLEAREVPEAQDALKIEESIQQSVVEARSLARGIFPVQVDRIGLWAALNDLAAVTQKLTGVAIRLTANEEVHVNDPEVAMHLYRISQEALANSVRHSGASRIDIVMKVADGILDLRIEDNGKGIQIDAATGQFGMGLRTMRYRAQECGAQLEVKRGAVAGTVVRCVLPNPQLVSA